MNTVLLRLAGPLQSWGASSKFGRRTTEREPTKSGVIGLVAAALGRRREDNIDDLAKLKFGVRIDQAGRVMGDYHTVKSDDGKQLVNGYRYYLEDAVFLAGLYGDGMLISEIARAIVNPQFPLFLGRRSCPPAGRICLGIRENMTLLDALKAEPWQAGNWYQRKFLKNDNVNLKIIMDADNISYAQFTMRDMPVSFNQEHRKFTYRPREQQYFTMPVTVHSGKHDPFIYLEDA